MFEIMVHTITIQTVAIIGPMEFSAKMESNKLNAAITVNATRGISKSCIVAPHHIIFCDQHYLDSAPFVRNTSISPVPKITILNSKAVTAIHNNKKIVKMVAAANFTNMICVRLTGFEISNRNVPIFASPEMESAAINATNIGTCINNVLRII